MPVQAAFYSYIVESYLFQPTFDPIDPINGATETFRNSFFKLNVTYSISLFFVMV